MQSRYLLLDLVPNVYPCLYCFSRMGWSLSTDENQIQSKWIADVPTINVDSTQKKINCEKVQCLDWYWGTTLYIRTQNVHRLLVAVHQHRMLRALHRLICSEPRTLLGHLLLGFFISVTIGRHSAKFQLPTSTAVLLVVVFSRTWLTPISWQECCLGQALVQIIAYLLTFWSSRFDSNRGLEGFYRPYMCHEQL